jgi:hypothetical protein
MTPRLKSLSFALATLAAAGIAVSTPARAASPSPVIGRGILVLTSPASEFDVARLAHMTPRGPTFSDRVSYPRYLGGYGIGPSARRSIETRTGNKTRSFLKRWASRHDTGFTRR